MCCQFTHFPCDDWDNVHRVLLCLGLGHETMVCAVCLSLFLWICDMTRLLRGTFVSWWYLPRICHSVTDMQHYYHARYPTDDWHLAYMFSLVYFSVEVCLVDVFPHSVSTRLDPCVTICAPPTPLPLPFIVITIYGVVCVQLAHFNLGDWKNISIAHIIRCLGLGHETIVCAVCLSIFLLQMSRWDWLQRYICFIANDTKPCQYKCRWVSKLFC